MNSAAQSQGNGPGRQRLSRAQVENVTGRIDPFKIAEIIATGATLEELEEAAAYALGESDVMGKARRALKGPAAQVYRILTVEEQFGEE